MGYDPDLEIMVGFDQTYDDPPPDLFEPPLTCETCNGAGVAWCETCRDCDGHGLVTPARAYENRQR